jgi:tetratricopeptide (TPR) repeat protein
MPSNETRFGAGMIRAVRNLCRYALILAALSSIISVRGDTNKQIDWALAVQAYRAGQNAYDSGKWDESVRQWTEAVSKYPSSSILHYSLATAAARAGDSNTAVANLEQALGLGFRELLQSDPDLQALHAAPEWPTLLRRYDEAEKNYRAAHSDPNRVEIHTEDVHRFWETWDNLQEKPLKDWPSILTSEYLDAGTEGLREYYLVKCAPPERFAAAVQKRADFYNAIRGTTLRLDLDKATIRDSFSKMKAMYPDAVFPDIYFVIGEMSSGGTSLNSGLILGVELSAKTSETPVDTLNDWQKANIAGPERLPGVIAHELVHYQQIGPGNSTLLTQVMIEGAADFIAARTSHLLPNTRVEDYARLHEAELWKRFAKEKDGTDYKYWLYGDPPVAGIPSDLGYWIGRRICESYYERAADKPEALREIIEMRDPKKIYAGSQYAQ